ncbi:MAG: ARMT1-like domain-containing protein [Candidatus Lernaella stagnicola]|nr:ARMT1-like domain-containing protein [Candidatus Lernaella stagnicola]
MKTIRLDPICQDCFARAVIRVAEMHGLSAERIATLVDETRQLIASTPADQGPPQAARRLRGLLQRHLGVTDPFAEVKRLGNEHAAAVVETLRDRIVASDDSFRTALRTALAGNVIDFAYVGEQDLPATVERLAEAELGIDDTERLREEIGAARRVLYLGDNTGEVWCDRLFIETLPPGPAITFATRESPVLNDATLVEARQAGLDQVCELISSGSDAPGAIPELLNDRTRELLETADVVVSKGQGNFEALYGHALRPVYFVFLVKCEHVVEAVGHPVGTGIVWRWTP